MVSKTIHQRILLAIDRDGPQTFQQVLKWSGLTRVVCAEVLDEMVAGGLITYVEGDGYIRKPAETYGVPTEEESAI